MANRLAAETSPYLLQHRDNPVDWYPWGEEARERAREEDLPILLSVGYSACHWCHVMERESFEDEATAAYMNEHFVCIKVDREERPDVDAIYMEAVQSMTGHGGWPMTVFLDPDGVPFYGGTYFPPDQSRGMPSFRMVMEAIVDAFDSKREEIRERAAATRERLAAIGAVEPSPDLPDAAELDRAVANLLHAADPANGGFGRAPKFPPASALELLLSRDGPGAAEHVVRTLDAMLAGGIYDQLGGGFARYSVDAAWLVPHFEKMLYDNALLAPAYLHGWQRFGHERYRRVVEETLDWMLREMRGPEGGFFSALDADSEGVEGKYYVWTPEELREVLGDERAAEIGAYYGVTERGNFEGRSILHLANGAAREGSGDGGGTAGPTGGNGGGTAGAAQGNGGASGGEAAPGGVGAAGARAAGPGVGGDDAPWPPDLADARAQLLAAREERVRPGLDDKRLTAWNALAIGALAEAGAVLGRRDYLDAAEAGAAFVLGGLTDDAGHLLRTYKDGVAHLNAYLEDHAFLLEALLTLYESTFEPRWFAAARDLADTTIARFGDPERGGFWTTASDHEELIARRKEVGDHPIPAGNSAVALGLLRLAALSGEREYEARAVEVFALFGGPATKHPESFAHFLRALDFHLARTREVALVGADLDPLLAVVRADFRPHLVLAAGPAGATEPPLLDARTEVGGEPAAYVCEGFTCQLPVTDPRALRDELDRPR